MNKRGLSPISLIIYIPPGQGEACSLGAFGAKTDAGPFGMPTPLTCMKRGENCAERAQRGIQQCQAQRGLGVGAFSCKEEWHGWFESCVSGKAQECRSN